MNWLTGCWPTCQPVCLVLTRGSSIRWCTPPPLPYQCQGHDGQWNPGTISTQADPPPLLWACHLPPAAGHGPQPDACDAPLCRDQIINRGMLDAASASPVVAARRRTLFQERSPVPSSNLSTTNTPHSAIRIRRSLAVGGADIGGRRRYRWLVGDLMMERREDGGDAELPRRLDYAHARPSSLPSYLGVDVFVPSQMVSLGIIRRRPAVSACPVPLPALHPRDTPLRSLRPTKFAALRCGARC
ncbi:hypothetical protein QBC39DRAFT_327231 [Podospora conica]|nr:hypothetical protein QBC39DRAFT_327231 [Schizothecium conicum]